MTTLTVDQAYSVADPCGFQVGTVACDGTPLLQAGGGDSRLYNGLVQFEYNEVLTPGRRDVDQTGNGVNCASRTIDDIIDGYTAIVRNCGKLHPGLLVQWGVSDPVFSDDGALIGTKGFRQSASCRCGQAECVNGGFYMMLWSQAYSCNDNEQLFDDNGDQLYEITIFPWIKRFIPTGGARRGANLADARRDLRATLKPNPNFLYGPGMTDPAPIAPAGNIYPTQPDDVDNPGLTEPYAQYLTTNPFPGACACTDHGAPWAPTDEPIPVGEPGWEPTPVPV